MLLLTVVLLSPESVTFQPAVSLVSTSKVVVAHEMVPGVTVPKLLEEVVKVSEVETVAVRVTAAALTCTVYITDVKRTAVIKKAATKDCLVSFFTETRDSRLM